MTMMTMMTHFRMFRNVSAFQQNPHCAQPAQRAPTPRQSVRRYRAAGYAACHAAAQIQQRVARCNGDPHMSVQRVQWPNCSKLLQKSLGSKNISPTSMEFTLVPHQGGSFEEGLCKRSASFMSRMSGYLGFP